MVSDIEPIFGASPALAAALSDERDESGRNTLLSRRFPGGSLKVVAAKAPRNLRRHNVRVLFMDEADGMEATAEGSPIMLAEKRTMPVAVRALVRDGEAFIRTSFGGDPEGDRRAAFASVPLPTACRPDRPVADP